jgi:hypothetical protein
MWRGALWGAGLGSLGAAVTLLSVHVIHETLKSGTAPVNAMSLSALFFLFAIVLIFAGPGAFVLSVPLQIFLRRMAARMPERTPLFVLALAAGVLLGLLNVVLVVFILGGPSWVRELFEFKDFGPRMLAGAVGGGLGLGLGCFLGLPRERTGG